RPHDRRPRRRARRPPRPARHGARRAGPVPRRHRDEDRHLPGDPRRVARRGRVRCRPGQEHDMRTVELGATGTKVSEVALGAMPLGTHADQDASFALLDRYVADGGAFIDTADNYAAWWQQGTFGGQSETMLG